MTGLLTAGLLTYNSEHNRLSLREQKEKKTDRPSNEVTSSAPQISNTQRKGLES